MNISDCLTICYLVDWVDFLIAEKIELASKLVYGLRLIRDLFSKINIFGYKKN
jgi:hypothetical protein